MNDRANSQQQMLEALELAGRGRDELGESALAEGEALLAARPELCELHRTSVKLDEALGRAVRDVPVPRGLEERILARLNERSVRDAMRPGASERVSAGGLARRRWIAASAGVAAALVLLAALAGLGAFSRQYTVAEVLDEAVGRFAGENDAPGEPIAADVVDSYPPSKDIRRMSNTRSRRVEDFLGRQAVAYEWTAWEGVRCALFVVPWKRGIAGLDSRPPEGPWQSTGGIVAGAWQTDGMLYVLVVRGDARAYRSFLEPAGPLT